jgi:hypothetical protein
LLIPRDRLAKQSALNISSPRSVLLSKDERRSGCPLYALRQVDDIRKADVEARELEAYAAWCLEAGERN